MSYSISKTQVMANQQVLHNIHKYTERKLVTEIPHR